MPGLPQPPKRFNLLLLDEGEFYFDDYAAVYYPPSKEKSSERFEESVKRKVEGRIKLCSASILFVPKDTILPITKFPFKHVQRIEPWESPSPNTPKDLLLLRSSLIVEMKAGNRNAPYEFTRVDRDHHFSLVYEALNPHDGFLPTLMNLHTLSKVRQSGEVDLEREMLDKMITEREKLKPFDPSWYSHIMEKHQLEVRASRVTPFVNNPGRLVLTDKTIYFQLFNNIDPYPVSKIPLSAVNRICLRRHALRHIGIEIFYMPPDFIGMSTNEDHSSKMDHGLESVFFAFQDKRNRDKVYAALLELGATSHLELNDLEDTTVKWQHGLISNYDYILYLNMMAGRSYKDISQYPVMPWVISDYTVKHLDLNNSSIFRDLSLPVGALNPDRLKSYQDRYRDIPEDQPKFLFGTHYSAPGYVLYFMVRQAPEYMLRLQNGKFDEPARMFCNVSSTWHSVYNAPGDVKELIPEFFIPSGDFLLNQHGLDLGDHPKTGAPLGDVVLPAWAEDPAEFVSINRDALESPEVSRTLHKWIDLIFGSKQNGEEALEANNLFYPLTYEGAVDVESISDPIERRSLEAQIHEFGQTPKQIFVHDHPPRLVKTTKGWKYGKYPRVSSPSAIWEKAPSVPAPSPSPPPPSTNTRPRLATNSTPSLHNRSGAPLPPISTAPQFRHSQPQKPKEETPKRHSMGPFSFFSSLEQTFTEITETLGGGGGGGEEEVDNTPTSSILPFSPFSSSPSPSSPGLNSSPSSSFSSSLSSLPSFSFTSPPPSPSTTTSPPTTPSPSMLRRHEEQTEAIAKREKEKQREKEIEEKTAEVSEPPMAQFFMWEYSQKYTFSHLWGDRFHKGAVHDICLAHDSDYVFTVGNDGKLKVYSLSTQKQYRSANVSEMPLSCCTLGPRKNSCLTGGWDNNLYLYSMDAGRVVDRFCVHEDAVTSLSLSDDLLVTASWDSTVRVWKCKDEGIDRNYVCYFELDDEVQQVIAAKDQRTAIAGAKDGSMSLLDLRSQKIVRTMHYQTDAISALQMGPDPNYLFSSAKDGNVRLVDLRKGELSSFLFSSPVNCLKTDGQSILAGLGNGNLQPSQVSEDLKQIIESPLPPKKHNRGLLCLEVSEDGDIVLSGGEDSFVHLWKYEKAKEEEN